MGIFENFTAFRRDLSDVERADLDQQLGALMERYSLKAGASQDWDLTPEQEAECLARLEDPEETFTPWEEVMAELREKHSL